MSRTPLLHICCMQRLCSILLLAGANLLHVPVRYMGTALETFGSKRKPLTADWLLLTAAP